MSVDLSGFSMVALFRMEAEQLTGRMTTALIDLEADPLPDGTRGDRAAEIMRGAHSLKGAAQIAGIVPLVRLAHAMEDRMSVSQRRGQPLAPAHVDALLKGTDLFARCAQVDDAALPGWLAARDDAMAQVIDDLREEVAAPREVAPAAAPASAPAPAPAPTTASASPSPSPSPSPSASTPSATPELAAEPAFDRQLRLDAAQLDSLLGLARESLLVNRAHQRQGEQLQRMRAAQRQLARSVERLHERVRAGGATAADQLMALVETTARASQRSTEMLEAHIHDHTSQTRRGHRIATRLHHSIHDTRMTRFGEVAATMKRLARDTGQRLGKPVVLDLQGAATRIDRDVLHRIEAPLMHMVRNAIDHGSEDAPERLAAGKPATARITVTARHLRGQLEVSVGDDGRGVDIAALRLRIAERGLAAPELLAALSEPELLEFLFLPNFTTRDTVSETSGRGVGLDVVQTSVQALGGRLQLTNRPGAGLTITLVLPVSLSLVRALLLRVGGEVYGLPLAQLERVLTVPAEATQWIAGRPVALVEGREVAWTPLGPILGVTPTAGSSTLAPVLTLVEIATPRGRFALAVDALLGERDLSLQALDARLPKPVHISAAAVLDDGTPLLVLDVADLAEAVADGQTAAPARHGAPAGDRAAANASAAPAVRRVLVVEDSFTVREVERKVLAGGGYAVDTAVDGVEGWNALSTRSYDLVVTDVDMPRMNGLELLRRIRANAATRQLPVMIVSYKDREQDRLAGLQAGADRYFVKSGFEAAALLEAVADLIG